MPALGAPELAQRHAIPSYICFVVTVSTATRASDDSASPHV